MAVLVELQEWKTVTCSDLSLELSDRKLLETQRDRLEVEELRTGLRITASSWVGVVQLANLQIRILPKLVGATRWLVPMLELAGGIDNLHRLAGAHELDTAGDNLLDLVGTLLCTACDDLWEQGLLADYLEHEEDLPAMRGRLLLDRQLRERFGRVDRLICRFDERDTDILENRLLCFALVVLSRRASSSQLRRRSQRLAAGYREQCTPEALDLRSSRDAIVYHRLNQHYRTAHELARLLLSGLGVRDLQSVGVTTSFAFLLDMNRLFEAFVDVIVSRALAPSDANVKRQVKDASVLQDLTSNKRYASVIPDLVVAGINGRCVPMDAKYKLYADAKADRADIYQGFLYAMAYRRGADHQARAVLLHPTSASDVSVRRVAVNNQTLGQAAEIRICSVPVVSILAESPRLGPVTTALREHLLAAFSD